MIGACDDAVNPPSNIPNRLPARAAGVRSSARVTTAAPRTVTLLISHAHKILRSAALFACSLLAGCSTGGSDDPIAAARNLEGIESLLVWQDGEFVFEAYFEGGRADQRDVRSVTKSVTALLFGIAVDQGLVKADDPLSAYLPLAHESAQLEGLTLGHLLTMTSGLDWNEANLAEYIDWQSAAKPTAHYLSRDRVRPHGTSFNYTSAGSHLIGGVIAQASGMSYAEFAHRHLFQPLGFGAVTWQELRDGSTNSASALRLAARDLVKLGQLVLNDGVWEGRRIVSSAWIEQMTRRHVAVERGIGYGYLWWVPDPTRLPAWVARGFGGQQLIVLPEHDTVLVTTARWRGLDGPRSEYQAIAIGTYIEQTLAPHIIEGAL